MEALRVKRRLGEVQLNELFKFVQVDRYRYSQRVRSSMDKPMQESVDQFVRVEAWTAGLLEPSASRDSINESL